MSTTSFDEQVAALRDEVAPQPFQGRKADATPEQWAAHLAYRRLYTKRPEQMALRRSRKEWVGYKSRRPEKVKEAARRTAARRKEKAAAWRREYRKRSDKDRIAQRRRVRAESPEQRAERRKKQGELERKRLLTDTQYAIAKSIRCRMFLALRRGWKAGSTVDLLGCSTSECMAHLERLFAPGMTWDNWGLGRDNSHWHIDHIRPVSSFDLSDPDEQRRCFHYTNLRPMWCSDNIRKGGAT